MARIKNTIPKPAAFVAKLLDGRAHNENNDCSVIAISLATGTPYNTVRDMLAAEGRRTGRGTYLAQTRAVVEKLGFLMVVVPTSTVLNAYRAMGRNKVRTLTSYQPRNPRFAPAWRQFDGQVLIMRSEHHMWCYRDGEVQDWSTNTSLPIVAIWRIVQNP